MDLQIDTRPREDDVVVVVTGEIDMATAPALQEQLAAAQASNRDLVLDLSGVEFMDSTGLQALVATRRRASLSGDRLRLVLAPGGPVERLLELTGLPDAFEIERV